MVKYPSTTILETDSFIVAQTSGRNKVQYLVDKEDEYLIKEYSWHISKKGYLNATKKKEHRNNGTDKNKTIVLLHRLIMNPSDEMSVDHINGNKKDNRRSNLRVCTNTDNARNAKPHKDKITKGVSFKKENTHKIWLSRIRVNNKVINLGYYKCLIEAQKAYNEAAKLYFGEYAKTVDLKLLENNLDRIAKSLKSPISRNLVY